MNKILLGTIIRDDKTKDLGVIEELENSSFHAQDLSLVRYRQNTSFQWHNQAAQSLEDRTRATRA